MDIREVPTTQLLGDSILFFAPMNGGKTEALVQELKRAEYFNLNSIAYNHERNTREKDAIVVDGRDRYLAKTVPNMSVLRHDLEERRRRVLSTRIGDQGIDGKIIIERVEHYKNRPLNVVGIDEVNLFCLDEKEAAEMLDFMQWCKSEKIAFGVLFFPSILLPVFGFVLSRVFNHLTLFCSVLSTKTPQGPSSRCVECG